ncbi:MAG: hypothetical protein WCE48_01200 [Steroidobacteraceae bacterium]
MTELKIDPKQVAVVLLWIVMVLSFLNGLLLGLQFYLGESALDTLVDFFDLDLEGNIPSLYSAVTTLACSGWLALIARVNWNRSGGQRYHWLGLSVIFVYLGIDEGVAIHEKLSNFMEQYMAAKGFLYFLWVVPYGIATAVLGLVYFKFWWGLPKLTRARFMVAGLLFVGGAVGLDMVGGYLAERYGTHSVLYTLEYSIEELLEMLGILLFNYALLTYLAEETGGVVLRLSPPDRDKGNS